MPNVPKRRLRAYQGLLLISIIALGVLAILGSGGSSGGGGAVAPSPPPSPTTCVWDSSNWDQCNWQ